MLVSRMLSIELSWRWQSYVRAEDTYGVTGRAGRTARVEGRLLHRVGRRDRLLLVLTHDGVRVGVNEVVTGRG